jgi:RHH-type proline utilization regulon transcriptional repressor/proline dehydrogenase/delta 1-pyrroline-5-carboxylate dehydrogenase
MRRDGLRIHEVESHRRAAEASPGTFMAPALIEIDALSRLEREVFGPVLHVLPFRRDALDDLVEGINALGYGLTLGIHSRVDQTIARILGRARVGNVYVNRNIVGAVVGVQPFGGEGLSGTGPKAGGPLYLHRFLAACPPESAIEALRGPDGRVPVPRAPSRAFEALRGFGASLGDGLAFLCDRLAALSPVGLDLALPGPTGERNTYAVFGRESVLCLAGAERDLLTEIAVAFAIGARAVVPRQTGAALCDRLPRAAREAIELVDDWRSGTVRFDAALCHGTAEALRDAAQAVAAREGPIVGFHGFAPGEDAMPFERLLVERVVSVNTTAAGGNATLMTVG